LSASTFTFPETVGTALSVSDAEEGSVSFALSAVVTSSFAVVVVVVAAVVSFSVLSPLFFSLLEHPAPAIIITAQSTAVIPAVIFFMVLILSLYKKCAGERPYNVRPKAQLFCIVPFISKEFRCRLHFYYFPCGQKNTSRSV
jgi:hypothetical protein